MDALDAADDSHDWRRVFDTETNLDTANAFKVHIDSVTSGGLRMFAYSSMWVSATIFIFSVAHEERVVEDNVWSLTVTQRSILIRKAVHKGSEPAYADLRNCLRKYDEIRKKYEVSVRPTLYL